MREKLLEKVRKLMALASSSNPHEAALALAKAQKLIAEYNLDIKETAPPIIQREFVPASFKPTASCRLNMRVIVPIIASHFNCAVLLQADKLLLVGTDLNTEIASHAVDSVLNQLFADFKREYRKVRSITFADSFWAGAAKGIQEKFGRMQLTEEITAYLRQFGHLQIEKQELNNAAFSAGVASGHETQIRAGVASNEGRLLN